MQAPPESAPAKDAGNAQLVAVVMGLGYVGVYLCRKNLSVALPILKDTFHATDTQLGLIGTIGTAAYMFGKFGSGPLIDRLGGRTGYLLALAGVALFGLMGGWAPGLIALTAFYALNRLYGAGAWNAIIKVTASWFPPSRIATAVAALSLSYVFGGVAAGAFAGVVAGVTHNDWHAIMAAPSFVLGFLLLLAAASVRSGPLRELPAEEPAEHVGAALPQGIRVARLFNRRSFQVVCILSFSLTLVREAFLYWGVDYLKSAQGTHGSVTVAALESTWFDIAGAIPILLMGSIWDRIRPSRRRWLIAGILLALAGVLALLATVGRHDATLGTVLLGAAGLLLYGPYSVLAGVVAIESGGTDLAGTATGIIDGIGYAAALQSGWALGAILQVGGYGAAFWLLGGLILISAAASLGLEASDPVLAPAEAAPSG